MMSQTTYSGVAKVDEIILELLERHRLAAPTGGP
jgi:hypothetical protein